MTLNPPRFSATKQTGHWTARVLGLITAFSDAKPEPPVSASHPDTRMRWAGEGPGCECRQRPVWEPLPSQDQVEGLCSALPGTWGAELVLTQGQRSRVCLSLSESHSPSFSLTGLSEPTSKRGFSKLLRAHLDEAGEGRGEASNAKRGLPSRCPSA